MAQKMVQGAGRCVHVLLFFLTDACLGMVRMGKAGIYYVSFNEEGVSAVTCAADAAPEVEAVKNSQVSFIARGP